MPRDAQGNFSLTPGYEARPGEVIQPSQHNPPLEDIAAALTGSLARSGSAPMTGPVKLVDGSPTAPGLAFNAASSTGIYRSSAGGVAIVVGGQVVTEFTATGLIGLPIGTPIPVLDDTLPELCIWADGRNVSRTAFTALFAKWGTKYGVGDSSTTFGMPDLRGTGLLGRDNIGGTDANRLGSVPAVSGNRLTSGAVIGEILHTLTVSELAFHPHSVQTSGSFNDIIPLFGGIISSGASPPIEYTVALAASTTPNSVTSTGTAFGAGGGVAHNNVQRSLLCNWAVYAGASA